MTEGGMVRKCRLLVQPHGLREVGGGETGAQLPCGNRQRKRQGQKQAAKRRAPGRPGDDPGHDHAGDQRHAELARSDRAGGCQPSRAAGPARLPDSKPRLYSQRAISSQPMNWMSDMKVKESISTSGLARNPRVRTAAGHAGSDPRRSKRVQRGEARGQQQERGGPEQAERIAEHLGHAGSEIDLHGQVRRGPSIESVLACAQQCSTERAYAQPSSCDMNSRTGSTMTTAQSSAATIRNAGPPARRSGLAEGIAAVVHRRK